jgi:hypothetical protein
MSKYDYMDPNFDNEVSGSLPLTGAPRMAMGVDMVTTGNNVTKKPIKFYSPEIDAPMQDYLGYSPSTHWYDEIEPPQIESSGNWTISADGLLLFEDEELISSQSMYAGSGQGHLPDEAYSYIYEGRDASNEPYKHYDDKYIKPEYMESLWVDSPIAPGVQYNPYTHNYRYNGEVFDQRIDRPKDAGSNSAIIELQKYGVTDPEIISQYLFYDYYVTHGGGGITVPIMGTAFGTAEIREFNFNRLDYQYEVLDYLVELGVVPPDHPLVRPK